MPNVKGMLSQSKDHFTAFGGEIIGTAMFLFIGEGAAKTANVVRTAAQQGTGAPLDSQTIMMIATSFGLALLVTAWMFYRITGGLFNPAITTALWLVGVLTGTRAILLFLAQIIGGIIAAALVLALLPSGTGSVDVVNTTLSGGTTYAQGFLLEMLGTSVLVFSVLMLAVEKHRATYLAPVGIGLTLFAVHLFIVAWTGCGLNPARSFGPAAVTSAQGGHFPAHHEIYWIAPLVGSVLSVIYFQVLKAVSYNSAVLDQDSDKELSGLRPVHMRVYKRLAGHKDWEREEEKPKKHRRFSIHRPHLHRHSKEHDSEEQYVRHENPPLQPRAVQEDGGLPLPVTTDTKRISSSETTVIH